MNHLPAGNTGHVGKRPKSACVSRGGSL